MNRVHMYIDGQFVESSGGSWFPVYDPSTEEIIGEAPDGNAADVDRAAKAAHAAFAALAANHGARAGASAVQIG